MATDVHASWVGAGVSQGSPRGKGAAHRMQREGAVPWPGPRTRERGVPALLLSFFKGPSLTFTFPLGSLPITILSSSFRDSLGWVLC